MPTQHTITLYRFAELPTEKAKQAARDWFRAVCIDDMWYDAVYMDAKNVGADIVSFDCSRSDCCEIVFTNGVFYTANTIKAEHGSTCDTYKAAIAYIEAMAALPDTGGDDEDAESRNAQAGDAIEAKFKAALESAYLKMLRDELEHVNSDEYIEEGICANEYTFFESGKRCEVQS